MTELSSLPLFRGVPPAAVAELAALAPRVELAAGEVLYRQGAEGTEALLLLEGALALTVAGGGTERSVGEVKPGEIAGDNALFAPGSRRSATVTVRAPSVGLVLSRTALSRVTTSPAVAAIERHMLHVATGRVRSNDVAVKRIWVEQLEALPAAARPAGLLDRLRGWLGA